MHMNASLSFPSPHPYTICMSIFLSTPLTYKNTMRSKYTMEPVSGPLPPETSAANPNPTALRRYIMQAGPAIAIAI